MSVVSDMVDDGALSGALMSFVGVSSCGAAIAGPGAQGECGQPGVAIAQCALRNAQASAEGAGPRPSSSWPAARSV